MADTNIRVVVDAVDRASNVLKGIGANIEKTLGKQTQQNISGVAAVASESLGAFSKLAIGLGALGLAATAVMGGLERMTSAFNGVIQASALMERSMLGLAQVSNAFAQDADKAKKAAIDLASDGLMTVQESAEGLKNLLATGFSLDEAITLMNTFKDASAANRQGTLGFGEAIIGATIGIKNQNSVLVDNVGISKNLSIILKEQGLSIQDLQNVTSDAGVRQKLYNGLLREGAIFSGAAADTANTLSGSLSKVSTASFNLSVAMGDILAPSVELLAGYLVSAIGVGTSSATSNLQVLAGAMLKVAAVAITVANMVVGAFEIIGGAVMSVVKGDISQLTTATQDAVGRTVNGITNFYNKYEDMAKKSNSKISDAQKRMLDSAVGSQSEASRKIQKSIEQETETYEREMKKRNEMFQERMDDLVRSHIDKKNSLMRDLAEENETFSRNMNDRAVDFKERMDDMVSNHKEKVDSINQQMDEENASYAEKLAERVSDFKASMEEFTASHESKVQRLQRQMDKEKRVGDENNNAKFLDLKEELQEENAEYERQLALKTEQYEKDLAKEKEKHDKKLLDLQEQLTKEDLAYQTARQKQVLDEEQQTARLQEEHNKRGAALQDSINKESEILNKHQSEVAAVKDKAVEDDITRLQKQHIRENEEALDNHNRKLKDLVEQGTSEGAGYGGALKSAMEEKAKQTEEMMKNSGKIAADNYSKALTDGAIRAGEGFVSGLLNGLKNKITSLPGKLTDWVLEPLGGYSNVKAILGLKQAGGVVPGAIGQPVPIMAHGGEYVTTEGVTPKGSPTGTGGSTTLNVYVGMYAGTEVEKRNIAEQLYKSLLQRANSQHKNVAEYMGG